MSTKLKTLVIDCNKWVRGSSPFELGRIRLLNDKGNMCCLGFDCEQNRGCKREDILDVYAPWTISKQRIFDEEAMSINDDAYISDKERIKRLRKCMKGRRKLIFRNKPK